MEKSPYINPQEIRKNKQKTKKKKKKDTRRSLEELIVNDEREVEIDENKKKKKRRKKTDKAVDSPSSDMNEKCMTEAEADAVKQKLWPTKPAESDKAFNAAKNMNLSAEQAVPAEVEHTAKEHKTTKTKKVQFPLEESPLKLKLEHIKKLIMNMSTVKEKHAELSKKIDEWYTKYDGRLQALEASVQSSQKLARSELDDITEGLNELEKLAKRTQQQRNKLKSHLRMHSQYGQATEAPQSVKAFINQKLINLLCALLLYIAVLRDYISGKPSEDKKKDQQENQDIPIASPTTIR